MESTLERPPSTSARRGRDRNRARSRPAVASRLDDVAWELPLGGLWIGLPLALAAIVLGLRARREDVGRGRATVAVVLAGLAIAQMVVLARRSQWPTPQRPDRPRP